MPKTECASAYMPPCAVKRDGLKRKTEAGWSANWSARARQGRQEWELSHGARGKQLRLDVYAACSRHTALCLRLCTCAGTGDRKAEGQELKDVCRTACESACNEAIDLYAKQVRVRLSARLPHGTPGTVKGGHADVL